MNKTIREWIEYYTARYGRHYRIRIKDQVENSYTFYWWELHRISWDMLDQEAKRVWSRPYTDEHGIRERELEIIY